MRSTLPALSISLSLGLAALLGFAGCDKNKGDTVAPEGDSTGDSGEAGDPEAGTDAGNAGAVAWKDMDRQQRMEYMGTVVMPRMKEVFAQRGYETFKCANCHGVDYKEVDFKMPNDLTPLDPANPVQAGTDMNEEVTKFMVQVVVPEMATMLGMESEPTTGRSDDKTFGCLDCHLPDE